MTIGRIPGATGIQPTIVDAKGDIIVATAADSVTRLAVGSNDTVLTADSAEATGLKWATPSSGMTLISTATASNSATISFTSIPQTYKELKVYVKNFKPATDAATLLMRFNSDATANRHSDQGWSASATTAQTFDATSVQISLGNDNSVATGFIYVNLFDYTNTVTWKFALSQGITVDETTTTSYKYRNRFSLYNQTTAITSLDFFANSGNITSGTFELYGVK